MTDLPPGLGLFDLRGKVAVVTGGNNGLGLGFAHGVARAGGDVAIWARRKTRNEEAAAELREHGGRVLALQVDVSDPEQVAGAMRDTLAELGRVDGAFVNAGFNTHQPSFLDITPDLWHGLLAVSLHGSYYTLRVLVEHMLERAEQGDPGGSIVTCGSLAITQGRPRIQHYAAAKGALAAVTRSIAVEYADRGIRANMILPGRFETGLGGEKTPEQVAAAEAAAAEHTPIPRRGQPADLEAIAIYLLSDASGYHTGDMITIDGGLAITIP